MRVWRIGAGREYEMVCEERDLGFRGRGKAEEDGILVVIVIIIYLIYLGEGERMEMKAGKRIIDTFVLLCFFNQNNKQTDRQTDRQFGSTKNHQLRAGSSSSSSCLK